jgi:hypothetical protein
LAAWSSLLIALGLAGCNGRCDGQINTLQSVSLGLGESAGLNKQLRFVLGGTGTCERVNVDWGDGITESGVVPVPGQRIEFSSSNVESRTLTHTFTGWGGGKTVTVVAASGCEGKVTLRFNAPPVSRRVGFMQPGTGTGTCATVSSNPLPTMIPHMLVHVQTFPAEPPHERGINFGCAGCVYDADGRPGSVADPTFPFPGLREYSLVLRIGSKSFQGGTNVQFTTTTSGPLELCLNDRDNDVTNNRDGYIIQISVDQLGPCTFTVSPTSITTGAAAGTATVTVTAGGGCAWTATTNDAFITVTSGASGTDNGTVAIAIAANSSGAARTGRLTIAGQTVTVSQSPQ